MPADSADGAFSVLREGGIDPAAGLGYCQNDAELYAQLLFEYVRDAEAKAAGLQRFLDAQDWPEYTVLVHALKSSSRLVGAGKLSGMAADLESAAAAKDAGAVQLGHPAMMEEYRRITEFLRAHPVPEAAADGPEIMDFPPV